MPSTVKSSIIYITLYINTFYILYKHVYNVIGEGKYEIEYLDVWYNPDFIYKYITVLRYVCVCVCVFFNKPKY